MRIVILLICVFFTVQLHAQDIPGTITVRKKKLVETIRSEGGILYQSYNNPIRINTDVPERFIKLEVDGAEHFTNGMTHILNPKTLDSVTVRVLNIQNIPKIVVLGEVKFPVMEMQRPEILFGSHTSGKIGREDLLEVRRLQIDRRGCDYAFGEFEEIAIQGFVLEINNYGVTYKEPSRSGNITSRQFSLLKDLDIGMKFSIKSITAITANGGLVTFNDLDFEVVD